MRLRAEGGEIDGSKLTMCNCSGDSAPTKLSCGEVPIPCSTSLTWDDTAGIKSCNSASTFEELCCDTAGTKSCTSASTGGGEGCLIISGWAGDSVGSKEISEPGSATWCIRVLSAWVRINSTLDVSSSEFPLSVLTESPSSMVSCRLFAQMTTRWNNICYQFLKKKWHHWEKWL